jgi:hypothetical protein
MPTTIPYDPSLTLGNIVHPDAMSVLLEISKQQAPIDAAQERMNSMIEMKRSLEMTVEELVNMKIDPGELRKQCDEVGKQVSDAAIDYAKVRIEQEKVIQPLKAKVQAVHSDAESPIDYVRTQIRTDMPLAADSLKMDAQYFSFDENDQDADSTISSIKTFVSGATRTLGVKISAQASAAAADQVSRQLEAHDVQGTLVITATCTHKNAAVLAPFVLDVDKAIRVWNTVYKDANDKIKVDDPAALNRIEKEEGTDKEKFLSILSGATFGSSFVGMVHILRHENTRSSQEMRSLAGNLQVQIDAGLYAGGFGADGSFSEDVKKLLSTAKISSHVSIIAMGTIPSIVSNKVEFGVKTFAQFDPSAMMDKLVTLQNATAGEKDTLATTANTARTGQEMEAIASTQVKNVMMGLGQLDTVSNQMLDVNSMMAAFEDYIKKAMDPKSGIGVPINYYVKSISRAQLAIAWKAKYFPGRYLPISGDDTAAERPAANSPSSQPEPQPAAA